MNPLVLMLKTIFVRKVADKIGATPHNVVAPSSLMGAATIATAVGVENPYLYFESLGMGPEGDAIIKLLMGAVGVYAIFSEKK